MKPRDKSFFDSDECKPFFHLAGETGVVLLHGFTGSVAHMRPLGDALQALGYTVMGINLPGHATTEADMDRYGSREWLQAALDAQAYLRLQTRKVVLCGLSMGAVLALLVAERGKADACVSISAPLPPQNRLLPLAGIFGRILPRVAWKEDVNRSQQIDPRYDKGYSGFPMRKGADLYRLARQAQMHLSDVACPTLIVQSLDDHTVSKDSADTIYRGISSMIKEKLILSGVPHVCTVSDKLPDIVHAIDTLLRAI
jgi:carboxylesterase